MKKIDPAMMTWRPWAFLTAAALLGGGACSQQAVADHRILSQGDGQAVYALAFSPNGKLLASGSADGSVKLWDLKSAEVAARFDRHLREVRSVAFSSNGDTLASGSDDQTVRLWSVARKEQVAAMENYRGGVRALAFSRDGDTLATGGGVFVTLGEVKVGDGSGSGRLRDFLGAKHVVSSLAFSPDGDTLASGGGRFFLPGEGILWRVSTGKSLGILEGLKDQILAVTFSPDGENAGGGLPGRHAPPVGRGPDRAAGRLESPHGRGVLRELRARRQAVDHGGLRQHG